jgi:hypothetical protein
MAAGAFLLQGRLALAQNSMQALLQELKEAKQTHEDMTSQVMTNYFAQVDAAMGSPDAALALYQTAGGSPPDPTPVVKVNEDETPTEKDGRLALDQANLTCMGATLQLQCGMLHYGALFIVDPNRKGLQEEFAGWLTKAAQLYPQLAAAQLAAAQLAPPPPPKPDLTPGHHKKNLNSSAPARVGFDPSDLKGKALRDTIITKYLAFTAWGDKDQGGWTVHDIPRLYRANVLDPSRTAPTTTTLAYWDVYIAMANADEKDNDKWTQQVYPPLQFDRAVDDYSVAPSTEKLEGLVNLIKANPTNSHADDWIARVGQLMDAYQASHGGAPVVATTPATGTSTPPPTADPNVTVTQQQQGDATIITTHTNAVQTPAPPPH